MHRLGERIACCEQDTDGAHNVAHTGHQLGAQAGNLLSDGMHRVLLGYRLFTDMAPNNSFDAAQACAS